jgi:predicted metal-dependent hydrolase
MDIAMSIKMMLPKHYQVTEFYGGVRCKSPEGMDEREWENFFIKVKRWLGKHFQEVFHNVNYRHTDFIIHYK